MHQSLGNCQSFEQLDQALHIQADNAKVWVQVWSPTLLQIQICIHDAKEDFSYALDSSPEKTPITITDSADRITLQTASFKLEINKAPLRFAFYTIDGQLINQDDPAFGTCWLGHQITTYKSLQADETFIGLGEKGGNVQRRGSSWTNWNTDAFAYGVDTDPLYTTFPFYIGLHSGLTYGIYFDNSAKSHFNFGASNHRFSSFSAQDGDMNYFFFAGPTVKDIVLEYAKLTGTMPLPPKWSLGYQQCRYSYYPDKEIKEIAQTFRDKNIPCDVMYFDIHYMQDYKLFTWDEARFPDPKKLLQELRAQGFRSVPIIDPGVKIEPGYDVFESGLEQDIFAKYPDGEPFSADVWPGTCYFPDFTKPEGRTWWKQQMHKVTSVGFAGFWNDMNEPASWGQDMPDLIGFDYENHPTTHIKARNVYGMQMARATYEASKDDFAGKRPFVLTRAGFSGVQRYAAVWTGDNTSSDESMLLGARMVTNLGLAGVPFAGYDAGGFIGDASPNLYKRWISLGAFSPFFRGHSQINTKRSEPWSYGEEAEEVARNYISLRYRLMPYIYAAFAQASETGMPVARSLLLDYQDDPQVLAPKFQNQYQFGPSFLVCPIESEKQLEEIYLPEGQWYDLHNDTALAGSQTHIVKCPTYRLPVFVKASSIVPMQSVTQHMDEKPSDVLTLHIYNGTQENDFVYYEDDGESFDYQNQMYYRQHIRFDPKTKTLAWSKAQGKYISQCTSLRIYWHGFDSLHTCTIEGRSVPLQKQDYVFIPPVSNFDPFYTEQDQTLCIKNLPYIEVPLRASAFEVSYI